MANSGANPPEALGRSEAFLNFMELLSLTSKVDRPVLIIGGTRHRQGTGRPAPALSVTPLAGPPWSP